MFFTALSGDAKSPKSSPLCFVLQIDDVKILLDCGAPDWCPEDPTTSNWEPYCAALESIAPSIDLVLFSHGDLPHIGLYAYAHAHWGLRAPAYSSLPVQALGRIAVTEEVENIRAEQDADLIAPDTAPHPRIPTAKEVATAFESLITLRYSQPSHLSGKCQGLTITPYAAGHTLGGTLWKIRSPSSGTIVYAVDLNHMKERHLDGTVLIKGGGGGSAVFEPLARPDLFITDADRALITVPRRKDRDAALLDTITTTLEHAHSLLLPCDSSARLLELLILLDQHWSFARLRAPICLMSRTGKEMRSIVRSLVEWMGGTIGKEDVAIPANNRSGKRKRDDDDDDMGNLALQFGHLEFIASPAALLQKYPSSKPKLILSVPASLSHGPSRAFFTSFASVRGNVIVLTSRGEPDTLSRLLYDRWLSAQPSDSVTAKVGELVDGQGEILTLTVRSRVPLQGAELEEYQTRQRAAKEREAAQQAALVRTQRLLEADEGTDSESDEEDGRDRESDAGSVSGDGERGEGGGDMAMKSDGGSSSGGPQVASGGGLDWSLLDADDTQARAQQLSYDIYLKGNVLRTTSFFKPTAANTSNSAAQAAGLTRYRMFPMVERKRRVDAYGETLDVGAWMRKGRSLEEDNRTGEGGEQVREEEIHEAVEESVPSKFISEVVEVPLSCQSFYVDLEGLNDGRAIKTIVPQVNPRKMIIVHASPEATESLISSCASIRAMTREIFAPVVGESIMVGQQTNTFTISLSDQLLDSVVMSRFEDNQVGYVHGRISVTADSSIPLLEPIALGEREPPSDVHPIYPTTSRAPTNGDTALPYRAASSLPQSTIIGDLKLAMLKSRLSTLGISAEFAGEGVLVCGGGTNGGGNSMSAQYVAVKKTGRGQVILEGAPSDVYYTVRQQVYGLHAVVADM